MPARILDYLREATNESLHSISDFDVLRMLTRITEHDSELGVALLRAQIARMNGEWPKFDLQRPVD